jgi:hypothetical protein
MRLLPLLMIVLLGLPANAQPRIEGVASVIDGDTIEILGIEFALMQSMRRRAANSVNAPMG